MARHHVVRTRKGLRYASPDLLLDLYIPDIPAPAGVPVVLYLHGGAWLIGSREDHLDRLVRLAEHGIAVASADYRFANAAAFPAQLHDAQAAVRWLRREGQAHGLATERIGVWGASAGAHIAAHLALAVDGPESSVQAMVGYFGSYDLTARAADARPDPALPVPHEVRTAVWPTGLPHPPSARLRHALLAGVPEAELTEDHFRALSPVTHVHSESPPMMLLHGTGDAITSAQQSRWLAEAVRAAGGQARTLLLDGANHEDPVFDEHETIAAVAEFFTGHLRGSEMNRTST
ncbi:alpha/beta hydrolase [Saccharopolyspora sp. NPDC050642]|uniref:alpha/beta hydrolase n=1 Tax=Saccharopolyspora sp. NPDC050642 TaxID=3157099 RepID=UPI0034061667